MLPVVDVRPLVSPNEDRYRVAQQIGDACRDWGFFYVVGHAVEPRLIRELEQASRRFFAQDLEKKLEIKMAYGGRAWRGYFPVGDELTSGYPDAKEGIYFGAELDDHDPRVKAGTPLHGKNLFPDSMPEFRKNVVDYMSAMTELGHRLMAGIALALGLDETYFADHYTGDPLVLFRIFNYPPAGANFGVGEHTDYGLLTILWQDGAGGLQIKRGSTWIDAPPIPDSLVCNIGDMLDRLSRGHYLSAPHRVRNESGRERLSFAFFFDPNFQAEVKPLPLKLPLIENKETRWDHASVHEFRGTYGEYLLNKVSKVFPELRNRVQI
jgi:isopenicillin N synthase-like dioxygenase